MKANHVPSLRKIVARSDYAERRIAQLVLRIQKLERNYFKRSDFSAIAQWALESETAHLNKKIKWYKRKSK